MNGEKAFIVAMTGEEYDRLIALHRLDHALCFWCASVEEAALDIIKNHLNGCAAAMWTAAGRWHYDIEQSRAASHERRMMEAA
jgi:putative hemolysin